MVLWLCCSLGDQLLFVAMVNLVAGEHMTMLEAMREVRGKIGMNPENESEDEEESKCCSRNGQAIPSNPCAL